MTMGRLSHYTHRRKQVKHTYHIRKAMDENEHLRSATDLFDQFLVHCQKSMYFSHEIVKAIHSHSCLLSVYMPITLGHPTLPSSSSPNNVSEETSSNQETAKFPG